ncbi:MAG: hypothetical protein KJP04_09175, partial [Arenicella sp.]|nr:hypothetical protein [Arenicella sp.]
ATPAHLEASEQDGFRETIRRYIRRLPQAETEHSDEDWGLYDIASQAIDSMQSTIASQKLAAYPPDYIVEIPRNAAGTLEVDRADELIPLGYQKAGEFLPVEVA